MSKVLITGATGFIGNHVTRLCLEQGDEVRVMVMPGEDRSPLDGMDVEFVEGNLLAPDSLTHTVQGVDQLYHLAALFAVWTKDPDLHYKINIQGAEAMLRAAMAANVSKVVFTSSVAAIGVAPRGQLANEETPFDSWDFASEYILSKFISHQMVKGLVMEGLPACMVLPGLPFGPGDRAPTPTGSMIVSTLQGKMQNYWDGGVCAVDVRDVAAGHVLAMQKGRVGESYILANPAGNLSHKEFLTLVGETAGVSKTASREVSGATMLRVSRVMEMWSKLTGKAPMTTYKNTVFAQQHAYVDPSKAVTELGLPQTPIETAVRDSVDWFRSHGYV
ncbi:NAD-dependent epimerase/dehydratase family protein [Halieaceae bacterium IMCC14734]|uniref:NAD-dependent epimerase/dehydratase family protein n=1 Tax=Candidatus Litorirhabdus singularis TaxID=2518993 RepID=A0ABT3TDH9_9GAMM|nr:SDR family oxidoreductase [Candidatus Litorirhabdus singularis]MCX2980352.1 NAD-dependent epimerase/dehydratase family protein [Candidatus Litorirhabdus singularis]